MKKTSKQIAHEAHQEHINSLDPYFKKRLQGLTVKEINDRADRIRRSQQEREGQLSTQSFLGVLDDVVCENGFWYGPKCRKCGCAPSSIGEVSLALYSTGRWLCDFCYSENPEDIKNKLGLSSLITVWAKEKKIKKD